MAKGYPFYSKVWGIGVVKAYHSHPECQIAHSIPLAARILGSPVAWPECAFCVVHHQGAQTIQRLEKLLTDSRALAAVADGSFDEL